MNKQTTMKKQQTFLLDNMRVRYAEAGTPISFRRKPLMRLVILTCIMHYAACSISMAQMQGQYPATLNLGIAGATNITWYKDNIVIAGATASTYSVTTAGTYYAKYTDPVTTNKCTSITVALVSAPTSDLGVTVSPLTLTSNKGENQVYSIVATNNGPALAPNAVVKVPIPKGRTLIRAVPTQGTYDGTTKLWTIGSMANAATATMTLTIKVD